MRSINVLHLTFDMRIGGTEQVIVNLIKGNLNSHVRNSVLCIEEPIGKFGELLVEEGIRVDSFSRVKGFDFKLIAKLRRYLLANQVDILHCHQYTPWVYGCIAALMTKVKVVFTEHGRFYPDSSSWKRKLVNPWLARCTDYITSISEATKNALFEFEKIPKRAVKVVYNGIVDLSKQHTALAEKGSVDDLVFGTIARLDPIKNQTLMISAFATVLVQYPKARLVIVGDGEERARLTALTKQLAICDNVIFTGYIARPGEILNSMDVFLLSSLSEGTSMTLLEAMALGKPCIVTDAGGNSEVILDGDNGIVTPNDDLDRFAQAMLELAKNKELRLKMSKAARTRFLDLFVADKMIQKYHDIYHRVLK